jgi:hypothetical protein
MIPLHGLKRLHDSFEALVRNPNAANIEHFQGSPRKFAQYARNGVLAAEKNLGQRVDARRSAAAAAPSSPGKVRMAVFPWRVGFRTMMNTPHTDKVQTARELILLKSPFLVNHEWSES